MNVACDYEAPMQMLTTEKYIAPRTGNTVDPAQTVVKSRVTTPLESTHAVHWQTMRLPEHAWANIPYFSTYSL